MGVLFPIVLIPFIVQFVLSGIAMMIISDEFKRAYYDHASGSRNMKVAAIMFVTSPFAILTVPVVLISLAFLGIRRGTRRVIHIINWSKA